MEQQNVLIVDGHVLACRFLADVIARRQNLKILDCVGDVSALPTPPKEQPDLVMAGIVSRCGRVQLDALRQLRKLYPESRLIAMSSKADWGLVEEARLAGANSFWFQESTEGCSLEELMDRTLAGESVFPCSSPSTQIGHVSSAEITEREMDVLRILAQGCTDSEIGDRLGIRVSTVRVHVKHLLEKCGLTTRTELAVNAVLSGTVVPDLPKRAGK